MAGRFSAVAVGRRIISFCADALFPEQCVGCGKEGDMFCEACRIGLPAQPERRALKNGLVVYALFPYADPRIRRMLGAFKFHGRTRLQSVLQKLIAAGLQKSAGMLPSVPVFLVPIPLSRRRERERGFNQAEEIAKLLLPFCVSGSSIQTSLKRNRATKQQSMLPHEERAANVASAFQAMSTGDRSAQFLLVDDVVTSGETLSAAYIAMKAQGYEHVSAFCFAFGNA